MLAEVFDIYNIKWLEIKIIQRVLKTFVFLVKNYIVLSLRKPH